MKNNKLKRGLSVLTACMMLSAAAQTIVPTVGFAAENLVTNSTFDTGTTDWGIYKQTGGACTLGTEDGKLALKITGLGDVNYSVQVFYDIVPLYKNGKYHVHYEVSSTVDRFVEGMIQQNGGTYQAYTWKGMDLKAGETKVMDYNFVMEQDSDIMAKLVFNCGFQENDPDLAVPHTIYLDNVSIELVDDSQVDYSGTRPYEPPIVTNQIGYRTNDKKTAVIRGENAPAAFQVVNADTNEVVYNGTASDAVSNTSAGETNRVADFSEVKEAGTYYLKAEGLDDSYKFVIADNPYAKLMDESVRMLYLQRCGCAVEDADFGHKACHDSMATIYGTSDKIDVSGGWHDAGDYGRYVVPGAKAVADLLYAYDANPSLFSDSIGIPGCSGNNIPDVLDEARYELEWMLKMQASDGGVYHKVSCATFPGYVMPEAETKPLIVTPVSSTATADFVASMALAYEFYKDVDASFADTCMNAAKKSWDYLQAHPEFNFKNPIDISTGDYGDKSDKDERYWAACQMFRATGDASYLNGISAASSGLDWSTVGGYGNIALLTMKDLDESKVPFLASAKSALEKSASTAAANVNASPYGSPITKYNWGSNMTIANAGIELALSGKADEANEILNYLLGKNPLGTCFVTGFGTVAPEHPHHRPSMAQEKAQPGMLVGGVNSSLEDSAAKAYCKGLPAAKCWVDNSESYSTNEITIYWNSPLTYLLALTEQKEDDPPVIDPPANVVLGDVNEDSDIDVSDAVLLARFLAEDSTATISTTGLLNADTNKNGNPDKEDIVQILRYIAMFISEF
ncbi:MAG TPA: glycosyl hydrolase family 9, cellulase [Ruminococcus sp.]|nr:glycosyl hydrolase family 9, cellulase [Ruminococcus sp.]